MKITKRNLAAVLRESVFSPSVPGPLKVIVDVESTDYYVRRAIEMCTRYLDEFANPESLTRAISLLALAKLNAKD